MNYTREPIIETVITPRDGCKLSVRSSKSNGSEEYFVDAIEVVSFGHSFFFRSQERPKSFLVPVSDYEIIETKEARMVLKTVSSDRSIKIGGGKDLKDQVSSHKHVRDDDVLDVVADEPKPQVSAHPQQEMRSQMDRKRDKRRRNRRGRDRHEQHQHPVQAVSSESKVDSSQEFVHDVNEHVVLEKVDMQPKHDDVVTPEVKAPSFISKLFPPPPTLIKETLTRYKPVEEVTESSSDDTSFLDVNFDDENEE